MLHFHQKSIQNPEAIAVYMWGVQGWGAVASLSFVKEIMICDDKVELVAMCRVLESPVH